MKRTHVGHLLRSVALLLAIVAALDPAITSNRATKPLVAVVAIDPSQDSAQASRVARELRKDFSVIPAPLSAADATVLVGNRVPRAGVESKAPVFAVSGNENGPAISLEGLMVPANAPLDARIPVTAQVRVTHAVGRHLDVTLRAGGVVIDHATRVIALDDEHAIVPLALVPSTTGATTLQVAAELTDVGGNTHPRAKADALINVVDSRWAVLFFDPRPSWMSTFVRRALEADPRFVVTSRVVTSRNISTDAGSPPGRLDDLAALGVFDAVVVGAPDALTESDVSGLDAFLRRRGGSVVLLLDQWADGPWQRLERPGAGLRDRSRTLLGIGGSLAGSAELRGSEIAWPSKFPAGAEVIARASLAGRDSSKVRPVVWRSAVGAGQLITSGALDSWRYRDAGVSGFDRFWRTLVADAAVASRPPLSVSLSNAVVGPGTPIELSVIVRDPALQFSPSTSAPVKSSLSVGLVSDSAPAAPAIRVPIWADGLPGYLRASLRAPEVPGLYRFTVSAGGTRIDVPFRVLEGATGPVPNEPQLLDAWAMARGGRSFHGADVGGLSKALTRALRPVPRLVRWHPMRSVWWILPFAMCLSGEWWLRRRRGLL